MRGVAGAGVRLESDTGSLAVLGLGGIGGMLAARTGALCIGTARTVEAVRGSGLTLVHGGTTVVAHPEAVTRLDRPVSLLVVAVKAYALEEALERVAPAGLAGAVVLPLLYGLEHVHVLRERLAARADKSQAPPVVAAGSIGRVEALSPEPGVVVQRSVEATITAASEELGRGALAAVLAPLVVPGVDVVVTDDEPAVLWEKAARLAVLAAATAASGRTVGELRDDPAWRERMLTALGEAVEVARAEGVPLDAAAQSAIIAAMPPDLTTSTARDAAAGRPTELDAITGAVVRAARRHDVPIPALSALYEEARCRAPSP